MTNYKEVVKIPLYPQEDPSLDTLDKLKLLEAKYVVSPESDFDPGFDPNLSSIDSIKERLYARARSGSPKPFPGKRLVRSPKFARKVAPHERSTPPTKPGIIQSKPFERKKPPPKKQMPIKVGAIAALAMSPKDDSDAGTIPSPDPEPISAIQESLSTSGVCDSSNQAADSSQVNSICMPKNTITSNDSSPVIRHILVEKEDNCLVGNQSKDTQSTNARSNIQCNEPVHRPKSLIPRVSSFKSSENVRLNSKIQSCSTDKSSVRERKEVSKEKSATKPKETTVADTKSVPDKISQVPESVVETRETARHRKDIESSPVSDAKAKKSTIVLTSVKRETKSSDDRKETSKTVKADVTTKNKHKEASEIKKSSFIKTSNAQDIKSVKDRKEASNVKKNDKHGVEGKDSKKSQHKPLLREKFSSSHSREPEVKEKFSPKIKKKPQPVPEKSAINSTNDDKIEAMENSTKKSHLPENTPAVEKVAMNSKEKNNQETKEKASPELNKLKPERDKLKSEPNKLQPELNKLLPEINKLQPDLNKIHPDMNNKLHPRLNKLQPELNNFQPETPTVTNSTKCSGKTPSSREHFIKVSTEASLETSSGTDTTSEDSIETRNLGIKERIKLLEQNSASRTQPPMHTLQPSKRVFDLMKELNQYEATPEEKPATFDSEQKNLRDRFLRGLISIDQPDICPPRKTEERLRIVPIEVEKEAMISTKSSPELLLDTKSEDEVIPKSNGSLDQISLESRKAEKRRFRNLFRRKARSVSVDAKLATVEVLPKPSKAKFSFFGRRGKAAPDCSSQSTLASDSSVAGQESVSGSPLKKSVESSPVKKRDSLFAETDLLSEIEQSLSPGVLESEDKTVY